MQPGAGALYNEAGCFEKLGMALVRLLRGWRLDALHVEGKCRIADLGEGCGARLDVLAHGGGFVGEQHTGDGFIGFRRREIARQGCPVAFVRDRL